MIVLLIEDDTSLAELIIEYLSAEAIECDLAYDGLMGLSLLEQNTYDLIITDVMMPRMDGYTLCRTMRSQGIVTPLFDADLSQPSG